jgi:hypothetical protein
MEIKEQFLIVQAILNEVAGREGCYPDGDIAEQIIKMVRDRTGNDSFCRDIPPLSTIDVADTFELCIETWENDTDHYRTKVLRNLTENDLDFYIELTSIFTSANSHQDPGMGNEEHDFKAYEKVMRNLFDRHLEKLSPDTKTLWALTPEQNMNVESRGNAYYELLTEHVLGYPVEYDWGFARVVDNLKVFTIKDGRLIEVTDRFK